MSVAPAERAPRTTAGAWVLFDLANTIYAATLTYLFTPHFTERFGDGAGEGDFAARTAIGVTTTASMVLAGLCVPLLGTLCDRTGGAHRYLRVATAINVAGMLAWALGGPAALLLGIYFANNIAYHTGLLFYNALLPSVAEPSRHGFWSGIGTGVGYVGNLVVIGTLFVFTPPDFAAVGPWFAGLGLAFLLFALPCLVLVRERRPIAPAPVGPALRASLASLRATLRDLPRHRPVLFFLLGNFFLVDVLNTAILFFGDYVKQVYGERAAAGGLALFGLEFGQGEMIVFLAVLALLLSGLALVFGIVLGMFTDRHPLGVMRLSGCALGLALVGGALFGGGSTTGFVLTLVVGGALGLAGIWTAGRKLLLLLAPPEHAGQYFGLYGITVKVSVLGCMVYGSLADTSGPQVALLAQTVPLLLGLFFLFLVRLPAPRDAGGP